MAAGQEGDYRTRKIQDNTRGEFVLYTLGLNKLNWPYPAHSLLAALVNRQFHVSSSRVNLLNLFHGKGHHSQSAGILPRSSCGRQGRAELWFGQAHTIEESNCAWTVEAVLHRDRIKYRNTSDMVVKENVE